MSRIGKQILEIPKGTEVNISGSSISIKGPQGTIIREFRPDIAIAVEGNRIVLSPVKVPLFTRALWGTYGEHLRNMIEGVQKPFEKQLILEGVGFRSEVSGDMLNLMLGFSHPVKVKIPAGLKVTAEKNVVTIKGIDKDEVGRFAAFVRAQKKPEPYKGKGFRYTTEVIRRKEGKKTV